MLSEIVASLLAFTFSPATEALSEEEMVIPYPWFVAPAPGPAGFLERPGPANRPRIRDDDGAPEVSRR
jgi:hypothetical protein